MNKTNLVCYVRKDSIIIFETRGEFYPIISIMERYRRIGNLGKSRFKRDDVYARLDSYEINMTRSEYFARDAVFVNKFYFDAPLKGILTDKVKFNKTPGDADYPQFDSYQKDFKIKDLYKDIDYEGGLSMQGAKLVGTGNRKNRPGFLFTGKIRLFWLPRPIILHLKPIGSIRPMPES